MAGLFRFQRDLLRRLVIGPNSRFISTSKKNSDTAAVTKCDTKVEQTTTSTKNWVSYGFDRKSEANDKISMHSVFFSSVTLCLVVVGFVLAYAPDYNLSSWATREAFLELRRREQKGLPLVDPNLIDPSQINLPSDEEIGDSEIII